MSAILKPSFPRLQHGYPLAQGLAGAWLFHEGNGNAAHDVSQNGNDGTFINAPIWIGGRAGDAISFNGVNQAISLGNRPSLNITGNISLCAWVKDANTTQSFPTIVNKRFSNISDPFNNYILDFNSTSRTPEFCVSTGGAGSQTCVDAPSAITAGAWTHIVGTYDGSTMRLFINGSQVAQVAKTGTINTSSLPAQIGAARTDTQGNAFAGDIDDVRIYSRALSAYEVRLLYHSAYNEFRPSLVIKKAAAGGVSHPSSGVLTGPGSNISGTAKHIAKHSTSGILVGQGSSIVGAASRTRQHTSTGTLTGQGSRIVGSAAHIAKHATSGILFGLGSSVAGISAINRKHASSGILFGQGSLLSGVAAGSLAISVFTEGPSSNPASVLMTGVPPNVVSVFTEGPSSNPASVLLGFKN